MYLQSTPICRNPICGMYRRLWYSWYIQVVRQIVSFCFEDDEDVWCGLSQRLSQRLPQAQQPFNEIVLTSSCLLSWSCGSRDDAAGPLPQTYAYIYNIYIIYTHLFQNHIPINGIKSPFHTMWWATTRSAHNGAQAQARSARVRRLKAAPVHRGWGGQGRCRPRRFPETVLAQLLMELWKINELNGGFFHCRNWITGG